MEGVDVSSLLTAFIPEEIQEHFELSDVKYESGVYRLYMTEKDDVEHYPSELSGVKDIVRCGYLNPCEIQTFPIAGHEAFIYIKRRRWKAKGQKQSFYNTYDFTLPGIKCTPKFGAFLKEIGRGKDHQHW